MLDKIDVVAWMRHPNSGSLACGFYIPASRKEEALSEQSCGSSYLSELRWQPC